MPPRVWRPKAATTRSRSPSPSKSAASTSVVRGSLSARTCFSKRAGRGLTQPHDRALLVVLGQEVADVGDEQVLAAVRVEVHHRGAGGVRDLRDLAQLPGPPEGIAEQDEAVAHVAGHDLLPPVAVEVEELRARHDGHRRRAGRAQEPPLEAARPPGRARARGRAASPAPGPRSRRRRARGRAGRGRSRPRAPGRCASRLKRFMSWRRCFQSARGASPGEGTDVARRALLPHHVHEARRRAAGPAGRRARGPRGGGGGVGGGAWRRVGDTAQATATRVRGSQAASADPSGPARAGVPRDDGTASSARV